MPKAQVREIGETVRDALMFPWAAPWGGEPVLVYTDTPGVGINWADCYRKKAKEDPLLVELGLENWGREFTYAEDLRSRCFQEIVSELDASRWAIMTILNLVARVR